MQPKSRHILLIAINCITFVGMLYFNYGYSTGLLAANTVADVSHKYDTLIAPANYTFFIWSIIFLMCAAFVVFQFVLLKRNDPQNFIGRTGFWFALSNMANAAWLYAWTSEQLALSVALIVFLLTTLIILSIQLRLELDDEPVMIIFFVWWPIVYYLGWIITATVACIAAWLISLNFSLSDALQQLATIIMLIIATAVYFFLLKKRNMREALGVGIWAFIGIAVKQWNDHLPITITAIILSVVMMLSIGRHGAKNSYYSPFNKIKRGEWWQ